jgi:hypothetical protein
MIWPRAKNLEPPAARGGWGGGPSPQVLASGPLIEDGGFTSRSLDSPCIGCSGASRQPPESTHATDAGLITLALACFPVGARAVVADERLGVDLCQPAGSLEAFEPSQHHRPSWPRPIGRL